MNATDLIKQHSQLAPLRLPYTRGNPYAKIVVVGEAPGAREERAFMDGAKDTAFVGAAGKIGDKILLDASIPPESVYFTNVLKRRPPENNLLAVPWSEILTNIELLKKEICRLPNCTILVPVGNLALWALTEINKLKLDKEGKWIKILSGITNYRGSILSSVSLNSDGLTKKVIPTFHFAYTGRVWKTRPTVVADFKRIREDSAFSQLRHPSPEYVIRPSKKEIVDYCEFAATQKAITTDIEDSPLCVGVSHSKDYAMCIPFQEADSSPVWSVEDEATVHRAVHKLFSNHKGHVGHFYYHDAYLYHHYGWLEALLHRFYGTVFDTFSAHVCLYAELPHSLQYLTSIYTREPYYKDEGRKWTPKDPVEQVWLYNCKDITTTHECMEELHKELREVNYYEFFQQYYMDLFPHLLQSMVRGMRLDELKRSNARREYLKKIISAQEELHRVIGRPSVDLPRKVESPKEWNKVEGYFNVKSNPQVSNVLTELNINLASTQEKYLRKEAARNAEARPIIKGILSVRSFRDIHSRYLVPRLGHDHRFHYTLKAATETGRLASSKDPLHYGNNCFTPDTEILTDVGWTRFDQLDNRDKVAQYTPETEEIEFVKPTAYHVIPHDGDIITIENQHIDLSMTPDHRCLFLYDRPANKDRSAQYKFVTREAKEWNNSSFYNVIHSGMYKGGHVKLPRELITLVCATQADGYISSGVNIDFTFKKKRKIKRIVQALESLNVPYSIKPKGDKYTRIYLRDCKIVQKIIKLRKQWSHWLLKLDRGTIDSLLEEVYFWDGHWKSKSMYASTNIDNVDWIQILHCLSNHRAKVRFYTNKDGGYCYQTDVTYRNWSGTANTIPKYTHYKGLVYCVTVPSSYILVRRNGKPIITGQCQNIPDGICRSYFVPDPGKVYGYSDLSQAEARVVAYLSKCTKMIDEFEAADEAARLGTICECGSEKLFSKCCGDVHRLSAANVFSKPVSSISHELRSLGKRVKHASNYKMGPYTFSLVSGLPVGMCKKLLKQYFITYPEVLHWHEKIQQQIIETKILTNPFGRWRMFFGHPYSDDTLREAVAFIPQSTIPDIVNLAYIKAQEAGIQILTQAHDALLWQSYKEDVKEAAEFVEKALIVPVPIDENTTITIPVDTNVGESWSEDDLVSVDEYLAKLAA